MNELMVFGNSEFGQIRTVIIDEKIYFVAKDVASALGYQNTRKAIGDHCKGVTKRYVPTNGGNQEMNLILEGDVYRLIIHSKLPSAQIFEKWVFDEVLLSIRKTGGYVNGNEMNFIIKSAVSEIMSQLPAIVSETVKSTLATLQTPVSNQQDEKQKKKRRINYHGKLDKLPTELRNEVITMIFEKKYTYLQVSNKLKEEGHDIHLSSVARYASRIVDELNRLSDIEIES